jgi:hypothetical protein
MSDRDKMIAALVSLSRTQSRLAQEYKRAGDMKEHDRLREESVWHARRAAMFARGE